LDGRVVGWGVMGCLAACLESKGLSFFLLSEMLGDLTRMAGVLGRLIIYFMIKYNLDYYQQQ
jgi:hypothetical protein